MKANFSYRLHQQHSSSSNTAGNTPAAYSRQVLYACKVPTRDKAHTLKMQQCINTTMLVRERDRLTTRKLTWKCFTNHTYRPFYKY